MNPPWGMYPLRGIVAGFISSFPVTQPLVLPADVSIAFGLSVICHGIHPLWCGGATPLRCAFSHAFMWM